MLIRPKSALYLSFPYNFSSKQEALEAKKKFKQVLNENQNQQLQSKRSMTTFISAPRTSIRYYKDSGPSLFHEVKKTYSHSQIQANFSGFKSQTQKPKLHKNQRLKPCRKICRKSIENMRRSLKTASDQTNFITNVLMNTVIDTPKLQPKQCQQNNVWFTKEGKLNKISTARLGKQNRFFQVNIHEKGIKIEGSQMKKESRETNNTLSSYQFSLNCKSIARNDVKVG